MKLNTYDKRVNFNCKALRAFVRNYINARKSGANKSQVGDSDLLSILLSDTTVFGGNDELIIDQLLDFFLAGTATVSLNSQNLLHRSALDKTHLAKLRQDIETHIKQPYREEKTTEGKHGDCFEGITYDRLFEMEYFGRYMQEVLRICPPAALSSMWTIKNDFKLQSISLSAGDVVCPNIWDLHHNPE
jgi:cytochrome P450